MAGGCFFGQSCSRKEKAKTPTPSAAESIVAPVVPDKTVSDAGRIVQMTHDRRTGDLVILFDSGDCLAYADVPESLYLDLARAGSAQKFFEDNIKGRFVSRPGTISKPSRPAQPK